MKWLKKNRDPVLPPEALIVGLGNPGPQYAGTRHNVGFAVIERLAKVHGVKLDKNQHRSNFGVGLVHGRPVVLCKPLTFMNLSGQAVAALSKSYGIKPDRILVVADDLDLPTGRVRVRAKGSSGGHNGHKSIIASLGTQDYPRIKIGIGKTDDPTVEHVLSRFNSDESIEIDRAIERSATACEIWLEFGVDQTMNEVNRT
ncbi:MAG: aminoacyl-tRNA hydrolase [Fimbriimonadaceae bacterium]|nr:aminoacyl-tRNA hydrolase [Fimbriimonadaceae bacterium]QYK58672.1 MAG: aminoacyl-tRNA hydrolase [Fimbriimonadaceae bacterium]